LLAELAPHIAMGMRVSLLARQASGEPSNLGPGLLVLADDFSVIARTPLADQWLAEVAPDSGAGRDLPPGIYAVAARLRALERGYEVSPELMPRIRLRTATGRWLTVHASRMTGHGAELQNGDLSRGGASGSRS
jgi:hypothetical protein